LTLEQVCASAGSVRGKPASSRTSNENKATALFLRLVRIASLQLFTATPPKELFLLKSTQAFDHK
jgi:hypothetical protein